MLDKKNRALKSRIFAPTLMSALSPEETREMIAFRCGLAETPNPFTPEAVDVLFDISEGVPREIVLTCDLARETARLSEETVIDVDTMQDASKEAVLREDTEKANAVAQ